MWHSETQFIEDFLEARHSTKKSLHIIKEFRTGYGLPDILAIEYDRRTIIRRRKRLKSSKLKPFNLNCAHTMVYLSQRRWIKLDTLKSTSNTYNGSIRPIIENLTERKLIRRKGEKIKSVEKKRIFAIKNIIAIEAKLEKWKRAILQVQRHLWFTNNCYVLIPTINTTQLNKIIDVCKKYHVGLITLDEDKTILQKLKMPKTKPYNTYLAWLLNELLLEEAQSA